MQWRGAWVIVLAGLAGCGRFGFDATSSADHDAAVTDHPEAGAGDPHGAAQDGPAIDSPPIDAAPLPITIPGVGVFGSNSSELKRTLATAAQNPGVFTLATWYKSSDTGTVFFDSGISRSWRS